MNKLGRPPRAEEAASISRSIRLTSKENAALLKAAKARKETVVSFMRKAALEQAGYRGGKKDDG